MADHTHDHASHADHADGPDDLADLLDLDDEVLGDYWASAISFVHESANGEAARVLDLGCGTGTGALRLAECFGDAQVIAIDINADSLHRVDRKAQHAGVSTRLRTLEVDLDAGWPEVGELDVTWASMSLHHMADPTRVLHDALGATRHGGLIAVAEFVEPLRFLPTDLGVGTPGLEERVGDVLGAAHREAMPTLGSMWAPRLIEAGWVVVDERDFAINLNPPQHPDANRYARSWFLRLSAGLTDGLDDDDRATLEALLDDESPHSVLRRTDLHIRGVRTVTIGRTS